MDTKVCSTCKVSYLSTSEFFNKDSSRKDGLYPVCKSCSRKAKKESNTRVREKLGDEKYLARRRKYVKTYNARHPERVKRSARNTSLKRKFGITLDDYHRLSKEQRGLCKICSQKYETKRMHVDHCHATGKIRGLLCGNCNTGLGLFGDNVDLLQSAINYLGENK